MTGRAVNVDDVARAVSDVFGVPLDRLRGRDRDWDISARRQVAFALAQELTGECLSQIGRYFRRDHTTVRAGIDRFNRVHRAEFADQIARARLQAQARAVPIFMRSATRAVFRHGEQDGGQV